MSVWSLTCEHTPSSSEAVHPWVSEGACRCVGRHSQEEISSSAPALRRTLCGGSRIPAAEAQVAQKGAIPSDPTQRPSLGHQIIRLVGHARSLPHREASVLPHGMRLSPTRVPATIPGSNPDGSAPAIPACCITSTVLHECASRGPLSGF
jgi:hypothetical protein